MRGSGWWWWEVNLMNRLRTVGSGYILRIWQQRNTHTYYLVPSSSTRSKQHTVMLLVLRAIKKPRQQSSWQLVLTRLVLGTGSSSRDPAQQR